MKEPYNMFKALYSDFGTERSTDRSRDEKVFKFRLEHEGLSFVTITLPSFSEQFFQCLENGTIASDFFIGWKKKLCLPAFLQGFTKLVFDQHTGDLLDEPSTYAIHAIRQLCNFYKKVNLPCTEIRENKTLENFVQTDRSLDDTLRYSDDEDYQNFLKVSRIIVSSFGSVEIDDLLPHHGPGSTYEAITGNKKYSCKNVSWYTCLEPYFQESILYNSDESYNLAQENYKSYLSESTVKVITVPKTLKGPRTIAMEPLVMQMAQQSVKDYLVRKIASSPLTSGHINFKDQGINQRLALESSITRALATLDMKDASDRIHKDYVYDMYSVNPVLRDLMFCTRSSKASVLGQHISLNKYASMGSALCFPAMSLYFYCVIATSLLKQRGLVPSYKTIQKCTRSVYVYGDDIIVPTRMVDSAVSMLTKFGNIVSHSKSFIKSSFRESCGLDAYKGVNVTPIYVRSTPPQKWTDASQLISYVETANQFFDSGRYNIFNYMKNVVENVLGVLPETCENCEGLGWRFGAEGKRRYNRNLQRTEVRSFVPCVVYKKDCIKDYNALSKCLCNLERKPIESKRKFRFIPFWEKVALSDEQHLDRSPRRGALTLKRRWIRST